MQGNPGKEDAVAQVVEAPSTNCESCAVHGMRQDSVDGSRSWK